MAEKAGCKFKKKRKNVPEKGEECEKRIKCEVDNCEGQRCKMTTVQKEVRMRKKKLLKCLLRVSEEKSAEIAAI